MGPGAGTTLTLGAVKDALLSGDGASHARTAAYFICFLLSLAVSFYTFPWRQLARKAPPLVLVVPGFSLVALVLTWRLIIIFFVGFTQLHRDHRDPPNLFIEAYALVCNTPAGWWWSSMLLCWVTVACPMAHAEARRRGLSPGVVLAYICTAFLGAVSLAFPLLLTRLVLGGTPSVKTTGGASASALTGWQRWLWLVCALCSLASIAALPICVHTSRPGFIAALAVVHVVLALPYAHDAVRSAFATSPASPSSRDSAPSQDGLPAAMRALAASTAVLHACATAAAVPVLRAASPHPPWTLAALGEFARALVAAAGHNVCQASISIDAALSAICGLLFLLAISHRQDRTHAIVCCVLSPAIGPAAALALGYARHSERLRGSSAAPDAPTRPQSLDKHPSSVRRSPTRARSPGAVQRSGRRRVASSPVHR